LSIADAVNADLTVVGPEAPLAAGIVDLFRARGRAIVGPTQAAARLETSKAFAKEFMSRAGLPTARYETVDSEGQIQDVVRRFNLPVVLKADGLAAGKGVVIARGRSEAEQTLKAMLSGHFVGPAGTRVVVEEFLEGEEVSFIALSDGRRAVPFAPSQDHKAVFDGDTGPNTGGMGAYSDERLLGSRERQSLVEQIVQPVIDRMRHEGTPFTGFLYAGLMLTAEGPKVLEFNVRLGDPETQPLMHRLDADLSAILLSAAHGAVEGDLRCKPDPSVCVVMAAAGYPGKVRTGDKITGLRKAGSLGAIVFNAGTRSANGELYTAGGRVLGVTASGPTLKEAIDCTYRAVSAIHFDGAHFRTDIGGKGLRRWYNESAGT
jgi:phosphoribosylamine--glycine ligase